MARLDSVLEEGDVRGRRRECEVVERIEMHVPVDERAQYEPLLLERKVPLPEGVEERYHES